MIPKTSSHGKISFSPLPSSDFYRRDRNDRRLLKRDEHNGEADEEEEADEDASFPPGLEVSSANCCVYLCK